MTESRPRSWIAVFLLVSFGLAFALPFAPSIRGSGGVFRLMMIVNAALAIAALASLRRCSFVVEVKKSHFVQAIAQASIYVYCSLYHNVFSSYVAFLLYQLAFATIFQLVFSAFTR